MSVEFFIFLSLGAAAGGFINGLAGFGTALFSLGFFLQIMPPVQAVAIVLFLSVLSGVQGVWLVRTSILNQPRRLARFLVPGLIGIPLGVALLSFLDPKVLKLVIAAFLILYGSFFLLRANLPKFDRPTPVMDSSIGFVGGVLGGAAALSGALPTMWCAMRPWAKSETRAVLQPYNVAILGISAVLFAFKGIYTIETLTYIAIATPLTMIFAQIGITTFKRLSDTGFRRLLIGLMFLSGIILMLREAF